MASDRRQDQEGSCSKKECDEPRVSVWAFQKGCLLHKDLEVEMPV